MLINLDFIKYISKITSPIGKHIFNISPNGFFVFVTGITSGYPLGISALAQMYSKGAISKNEALRLSVYCSNSGPLFILASLGAVMLKNNKSAVVILACHYLSAAITGIAAGRLSAPVKPVKQALRQSENISMPFGKALSSAITSSCSSMITVGGFIVIFSVINCFVSQIRCLSPIIPLLEVTNGCAVICQNNTVLKLPLLCALVSFGGLSVYAQSAGFLSSCGLSSLPYFAGRVLSAIISFALCCLYIYLKALL